MNSVERVRAICAERKIPISRIERDLGFSNGYIGQLRKGIFPADRLAMIAEYLGVTTAYLLTGNEKTPTPEGERELPHAKYREVLAEGGIRLLLDADAKVPQEHLDDIIEFIKFKQQQYGR